MSPVVRRRSVWVLGALSVAGGVVVALRGPPGAEPDAPALQAPRRAYALPDGALVVLEQDAHRIVRIEPGGAHTVLVGTGEPCDGPDCGDRGPADLARLNHPSDLLVGEDGTLIVSDTLANRVRRMTPGGSCPGCLVTLAGTGRAESTGDGGQASRASLHGPAGLAWGPRGDVLVTEAAGCRVRRIMADGRIETVAGTGRRGFSGDGGPAIRAELNEPAGVASLPSGGFLIADTDNGRIRRVDAAGQITTLAGTGLRGHRGDGGPARDAMLNEPEAILALDLGGALVADTDNDAVRHIDVRGVITTLLGAPALHYPKGLSRAGAPGEVLIADTDHGRIMALDLASRSWRVVAGRANTEDHDGDASLRTEERERRVEVFRSLRHDTDTRRLAAELERLTEDLALAPLDTARLALPTALTADDLDGILQRARVRTSE